MKESFITLGREAKEPKLELRVELRQEKPQKRRRRRPTVKQLERLQWLARYGWLYCADRFSEPQHLELASRDEETVRAFDQWVEAQKELTKERGLK